MEYINVIQPDQLIHTNPVINAVSIALYTDSVVTV